MKSYTKFYSEEGLEHATWIYPYQHDIYSLVISTLEMVGLSMNEIKKIKKNKPKLDDIPEKFLKKYPNLIE